MLEADDVIQEGVREGCYKGVIGGLCFTCRGY